MSDVNVRQHKFIVTCAKKNPKKFASMKIEHVGKPEYTMKLPKDFYSFGKFETMVAKHISDILISCEMDDEDPKTARADGIPTTLLPQSKRYRKDNMITQVKLSLLKGLEYILGQISPKGRFANGAIEIDLWWLAGQTNKISVTFSAIIDDDTDKGVIVEKQLEVTA